MEAGEAVCFKRLPSVGEDLLNAELGAMASELGLRNSADRMPDFTGLLLQIASVISLMYESSQWIRDGSSGDASSSNAVGRLAGSCCTNNRMSCCILSVLYLKVCDMR